MTSYGLLIFDGADKLDFTGPWEVFAVSSILRNRADTASLIAAGTDVITCQKGMQVMPSHTLETTRRWTCWWCPAAAESCARSTIR